MTLERTKIALLFSIMVLPLGIINANADGTAEVLAVCGFSQPNDIPLGYVVYDVDSDPISVDIDVEGTALGTLQLQATNWENLPTLLKFAEFKDANDATFELGETVIVNGNIFTAANAYNQENSEFDKTSYSNLGHLINVHFSEISVTNNNGDIEMTVSASYPDFYISLSEQVADPAITVTTDDVDVRMYSESTRYKITTDGSTPVGTYPGMTPFGLSGESKTLTTVASPGTPIKMLVAVSGVDTLVNQPFTGAIQQTWIFTYSCTE